MALFEEIKFCEPKISKPEPIQQKQAELAPHINTHIDPKKNNDILEQYKKRFLELDREHRIAFTTYQKKTDQVKAFFEKYKDAYIKIIAKSYLTKWNNSGKFPKDEELTNCIFHLAGLPYDESLAPEIKIVMVSGESFQLSYLNKRLNQWITLNL